MKLSEKMWALRLAQPPRTKARAEATAGGLPDGGTLELKAGESVLRTIDVAAWSVGQVQSDGRYPLIPGTFTDPETGAGTPDTAVFKDDAGDWMIELTAGVGSGEFRLANPLTESEPISRGVFVVLDSTDDIPIPPEEPPEEPPTTDEPYVDVLIDDMRLFHDGPSDVLTTIPSWGSAAFLPESYARPSGWTDGLFWFHVMEDTSNLSSTDAARGWLVPGPYTGNGAPNTRIQARDLQLWYLDMSDVWRLHGHAVRPGSYMPPNSWGAETGAKSNTTWRDETSNGGGASVRDIGRGDYEDHTWHAFTSPKTLPAHKGLASCFFARRILDNPDGADDRSACRILGACAGDYYIDAATSAGGPKIVGVTVRPMGYSRFKYMTNAWRMFGFYSKGMLTEAQIRANPPPFIGV